MDEYYIKLLAIRLQRHYRICVCCIETKSNKVSSYGLLRTEQVADFIGISVEEYNSILKRHQSKNTNNKNCKIYQFNYKSNCEDAVNELEMIRKLIGK